MRIYTIISLIFCSCFSKAQVEYAQTYSYPIDIENNFFNHEIFYNNRDLYVLPYNGGVNLLTNTGEIPYMTEKTKFSTYNNSFAVLKDSTILSILPTKISIYKNKNSSFLNLPNELSTSKRLLMDDTMWSISKNNDAIYYLDVKKKKFCLFQKLDPSYHYNWRITPKEKVFLERSKGQKYEFAHFHHQKNFSFKRSYMLKNTEKVRLIDDNAIYHITSSDELIREDEKEAYLIKKNYVNGRHYKEWTLKNTKKHYELFNITNNKATYIPIDEHIRSLAVLNDYKTAYFGTTNMLFKTFSYLKKTPYAFNNNNSKSCFTLIEDDDGDIIAGSYDKSMSIIKKDTIIDIKNNPLNFLIGKLNFNGNLYFIGERSPYNGIWKYDKRRNIFEGVKGTKNSNKTGFYLFQSSKNKIYYGTQKKGLWEIDEKDLMANNGKWNKINFGREDNILTITEDDFGRIYYGGSHGFGIYNPKTKKNTYYKTTPKTNELRPMCSIKDPYGTIWFGGKNGIHYIKPTKKTPVKEDFKSLNHPLLSEKKVTTAFSIVDHYLIIAKQDKILVLDVEKFNKNNELNVKYLTQHESNFSASTEQNTLLTAKDNTIWFSTTDMIYHWDFNTWLHLPKEKIRPVFFVVINHKKTPLYDKKKKQLNPSENSFKISCDYFTQDRFPRYMQYAFQYEKDSVEWSKISTKNTIQKTNLKAGSYTLHVKIFELDGSTSYYKKVINVPLYWFQKWYFWAVIALFSIIIVSLFIYGFQERKIIIQRNINQSLEWDKERQKTEKKLAKHRLMAISNQFRPHFLLNTFNAIGARLDSNSYEEKLLDTLGNSIDILFSMSKENKNHLCLDNEWKLLQNIIKIYQLVYIKNLNFTVTNEHLIHELKNQNLPFGILQIPIENALLHGLHNKIAPPYNLSLTLTEDKDELYFTIIDNGVGIEKAQSLSNVRKNGTGLKNLNKMISIFNQHNETKITFKTNSSAQGTIVHIKIPKNFNYDISNN